MFKENNATGDYLFVHSLFITVFVLVACSVYIYLW